MVIKKIKTVETTATVHLFQHWTGDQWVFIAEVREDGKMGVVYDAHLNLKSQIVLTKTRYTDGRSHAWFRSSVQHTGNCHNIEGYRKNWDRAVKSHMLSHKMAQNNQKEQQELGKAFVATGKSLDGMEIVFG